MSGSRRRSDCGESLLEVLMAVAIIGIAFAAILAGLGTAVTTSGINREQADDTAYVRAIAERIEAAPFPDCTAAPTAYTTALDTAPAVVPPGGAVQSSTVAYWNGSSFVATCLPLLNTLHRVTVTTTPADGRASAPRSLEVVKRKP